MNWFRNLLQNPFTVLANLSEKGSLVSAASTPSDLVIVEGVGGFFNYHLAKPTEFKATHLPLCGKSGMMYTSIPLDAWGVVMPHIRERYCAACEQIARDLGVEVSVLPLSKVPSEV